MTKLAEQLKQGADQAWESLSEGWRELSARASGALTRYRPTPTSNASSTRGQPWLPPGRWALMAANVFDDDDKVIVRIEAHGVRREDLNVELHRDVLTVSGEKRFEREARGGRYAIVQCAYGSFRRDVALPTSVKPDKTKASYRDGVLRVELQKADSARPRRVPVQAI